MSAKVALAGVLVAVGAVVWFVGGSGKRKVMNVRTEQKTPVEVARRELALWERENDETEWGAERVQTYWTEGAGMDRQSPDVPWSGAFIQYVMRNSSARGLLPVAARHAVYARLAINDAPKYSTYPVRAITEPRVGDIVVKGRPGESPVFDDLFKEQSIPSHADIVVKVEPHRVLTIGGNKTGGKVGTDEYPRVSSGAIDPSKAFAVIRPGKTPEYYHAEPGWRRALQSEVTPEMYAHAMQAVALLPLGAELIGPAGAFKVVIETHSNAARGASVFLPEVIS